MKTNYVLAFCLMGFSVMLMCADGKLASHADDGKVILTTKPGPAPRINGPRQFYVCPGHEFIYRIPCTGNRPMEDGSLAVGLFNLAEKDIPCVGLIH